MRRGQVRRAKLYYLRERRGKSARIAEKVERRLGLDLTATGATAAEAGEDAFADATPLPEGPQAAAAKTTKETKPKKKHEAKKRQDTRGRGT